MKATTWTVAAAACVLVGTTATAASAQDYYEGPYLRAPVRAPTRALEIGVSTEYTQGFGLLATSDIDTSDLGATDVDAFPRGGINDIADAGMGVTLNLGYRASPTLGFGWSGQYQMFEPGESLEGRGAARGVVTSVAFTAHTMPYQRVDPWIMAGAGYRMLWSVPDGPNNNVLRHGFQLAKLAIGADIRATNSIAVGPYIGADLSYFVWNNPEGPIGNTEIEGKRISTFVYAGVQGTFDVGGERRASATPIMARR